MENSNKPKASLITRLWQKKQYRYLLPLLYLLLILVSFFTLLIFPIKNVYIGGLMPMRTSIPGVIIVLLAVPGILVIQILNFIIPKEYYSWYNHSGNELWCFFIASYAAMLIVLFLLGLIIDVIKKRKNKIVNNF